jgi:hypothetical protein
MTKKKSENETEDILNSTFTSLPGAYCNGEHVVGEVKAQMNQESLWSRQVIMKE